MQVLRKENSELRKENALLHQENTELRNKLKLGSRNSGLPPSSDRLWDRLSRPTKTKGKGRQRGGQHGHKGSNLKRFTQVDHSIDHRIEHCPICQGTSLIFKGIKKRQVVDIPAPRMEVVEHRFHHYQCNHCGHQVVNTKIDQYNQAVQYGSNLKGLVSYLSCYQLLPYKRLVELINDIYGHQISQGSISNFTSSLSNKLTDFITDMKNHFIHESPLFHSDETSCVVHKTMCWLHVYCDEKRTLLLGHRNRGRKAMDSFGILEKAQGIVVHDRYRSYDGYTQLEHALCNAHLLRDLKWVEENTKQHWAIEIKEVLLKAKSYKDNEQLSSKRIARLQKKYEGVLRKNRSYYDKKDKEVQKTRGRPKRTKDHNLFLALWKYRKEVLLFLHRVEVPFDNNQAERDLRMFKVKMKISGLFQSEYWMQVNADIRSFISTAKKNGINPLIAVQSVFKDIHFAKLMAV